MCFHSFVHSFIARSPGSACGEMLSKVTFHRLHNQSFLLRSVSFRFSLTVYFSVQSADGRFYEIKRTLLKSVVFSPRTSAFFGIVTETFLYTRALQTSGYEFIRWRDLLLDRWNEHCCVRSTTTVLLHCRSLNQIPVTGTKYFACQLTGCL